MRENLQNKSSRTRAPRDDNGTSTGHTAKIESNFSSSLQTVALDERINEGLAARLDILKKFNLSKLENYFLLHSNLLSAAPSTIEHPRVFTPDESLRLVDLFVKATKLADPKGLIFLREDLHPGYEEKKLGLLLTWLKEHRSQLEAHPLSDRSSRSLESCSLMDDPARKSLHRIMVGGFDAEMSVLTPAHFYALASAYCKLADELHCKSGNFVMYIARDAGPVFETDRYIQQLQQHEVESSLIYQGGMKVLGETTSLNAMSAKVIAQLRSTFFEQTQDQTYLMGDGYFKLREKYEQMPGERVFQAYTSLFCATVSQEIGRESQAQSGAYKQAKALYDHMRGSGNLSGAKKVTIYDSGGSGKTVLLCKAIFDHFSRLENLTIQSDVLLGARYNNSGMDMGPAIIPGFPVVAEHLANKTGRFSSLNKWGSRSPGDLGALGVESDVYPFYIDRIANGAPVMRPSNLSCQVLCLLRSISNWNAAVQFTQQRAKYSSSP